MMMYDQCNTALHKPLCEAYETSLVTAFLDVRLHKNQVSLVSDISSSLVDYLKGIGSTTKHFSSQVLILISVYMGQCRTET